MADTRTVDSDALERRVALLRDDVAVILRELEQRYQRVVETPRRLEDRSLELGGAVLGTLVRNASTIATAALVIAGGAGVALWLRSRNRRLARMERKWVQVQRRLAHATHRLMSTLLDEQKRFRRALGSAQRF